MHDIQKPTGAKLTLHLTNGTEKVLFFRSTLAATSFCLGLEGIISSVMEPITDAEAEFGSESED